MNKQPAESDVPRRRLYVGWYHVREWRWCRTFDGHGPAFQINFGRLGITIPTRVIPPGVDQ